MRTRRMAPMLLGLGLVFAGAFIILLYYYDTAGGRLPFASERYAFKITIEEPQQLLKHADVRAAGVTIGEVNEIENRITPGRTLAIVELAIEEEQLEPMFKDSKFLVRQKTLVGENYIEVRQGDPRSGAIPEGATLGLANQEEVVPLDLLLGTLDDETRDHVRANFRTLGEGFEGRSEDFAQTLSGLQPLFNDGGRTIATLDEQKESVAEAVKATGIVTNALANRESDAQTLVRAVKRTAQSVERRDEELNAFFEELSPTLTQARSTVSNLSGFSARATPVVSDLRRGITALEQPVRDLGPTATQARTLFNELDPALEVIEPMVDRLKPFADAGIPAIPQLDALMRQTNPFARYLKPFDRDIGSFLANFSSGHQMKSFFGQMTNCSCPVSQEVLEGFLPYEPVRKAIDAFKEVGLVRKVIDDGTNHYRGPNELPDQSKDFVGPYPNVAADTK